MIVSKTSKPAWLNKKISLKECYQTQTLLNDLNLNTVCQQASCPNIGECFSMGEATFLILGKICTRNCRFCGVEKGKPLGVDLDESQRIAEAVRRLNLRHVVITSVTRDDLPLGGAEIFVRTISSIRKKAATTTIEVLIPDFQLNFGAIKVVVDAKPEIINHNVETVPSLYDSIRPMAIYHRSLEILRIVKRVDSRIFTKSGLMLGLGEKEDEVLEVFYGLRQAGCDFLSIGQYLSPSLSHFPVKEYISPEKFIYYKERAVGLGFLHVKSAPYVRSSYLASEYLEKSR